MSKDRLYRLAAIALPRSGLPRRFNDERLRMPVRWARFYPKVYEPEKHRFLRANCPPGGTVVDAGAHIGPFTVVIGRAVGPAGRVISLEPAPRTREVLSEVVEINGLADVVEIRPEALGAADGSATLYVPSGPASNASSTVGDEGAGLEAIEVATTSLTSLLSGSPVDLVKLDIEGDELDALAGARELLLEARPALAVEVHPEALADRGRSATELLDLLDELGYRVRDAASHRRLLAESPRAEPFELQALAADRSGPWG